MGIVCAEPSLFSVQESTSISPSESEELASMRHSPFSSVRPVTGHPPPSSAPTPFGTAVPASVAPLAPPNPTIEGRASVQGRVLSGGSDRSTGTAWLMNGLDGPVDGTLVGLIEVNWGSLNVHDDGVWVGGGACGERRAKRLYRESIKAGSSIGPPRGCECTTMEAGARGQELHALDCGTLNAVLK